MQINKATRIEYATLGKRFLAFFLDVVLTLFVGLGFYIGISKIFSNIDSISEMKVKYDSIVTESGVLILDGEDLDYKEFNSFEEGRDAVYNFYHNYLPKYTDETAKDEEWFNVFVLGLDDVNGTYSSEELSHRNRYIKDGKEIFEYKVVSGNIVTNEIGIPKSYNQGEKTYDELSREEKALISNHFNGANNRNRPIQYDIARKIAQIPMLNELYENYIFWNTTMPLILGIMMGYIVFFVVIPLALKDGKTLGKLFLKISVINASYYAVKKSQLVLRYVPQLLLLTIAVLFIGINIMSVGITVLLLFASYLMAIFKGTHQSIHDYVAGTIVVSDVDSLWFKNQKEESIAIKERE